MLSRYSPTAPYSTLFEVLVGWGTTLERLPPNIHVLHVRGCRDTARLGSWFERK